MAVEAPVLYNDWWVYLRDTMGSTHLNPNDKQIWNAYKMRAALQAQGYCDKAIAGVIGNAQVESSLTTGAIQKPSVLPNNGETLADCTNQNMIDYYTPPAGTRGYGLGLLQWDGRSSTYQQHKLVGWTNANGYLWYDGNGQMARLAFEFANDSTYHFWSLGYGQNLTWAVYKNIETSSSYSHYTARDCADVWRVCWEVGGDSSIAARKDNAAFWYNYFQEHPTPPFHGLPPWLLYQFNKKKVLKNVKRF